MGKGMQFLIEDSYTMDEVDDDDDDPSPSLSSPPPPPPQSNEEAEQRTNNESDLKRPPEELLSSPQTSYVEEEKSDSVGSSNALADAIILNESDESDDHENKEIASSLFADLSITPQSSNLHEEAIPSSSSSTQNNTIESSPAVIATIDSNISGGKKTMAMVKFCVWDPAAPSKQFKFITATTVLLLPQSNNIDDDDKLGNNESSSNGNVLGNFDRMYKYTRQRQQRLSSVKEERRGSRDSTIYDDTTDEDETDTNTSNHCNNGGGEDDEQQQQEGGRRRTIKIDDKSIKNNLSQLSNDDDDDDDENDDDKMNQLQLGNVVGIYLKKSSLSSTKTNNNSSSSSAQQTNNTTTAKNINEWKVGNSIRVLHNLNLIPLHTTGLEQLLHQIESNHPSLRELILDGITTIPQQYSLSTTTTSQQQHQLLTPLSTSHMEVLIEAIGKNTSIKKCSIRYSQITDDIASMLALALVDNTTMTSLSLRGNQLTSSSIKNFYSVLKSDENISLRLLDISDNSLIEDDVQCAFEQFMQQRNMKRKLILRAEKAKRIARGMPLLNEMLEEEEEEEEEGGGGWRIGSGVVGGRRHVTNNGSDGGGSSGGCCVTVVCHPGIMDGTFYNETQLLLRRSDGSSGNSFGSYPQSVGVMAGGGSRAGEEEEYQRFAESVSSDITGIGNEGAGGRGGSPSQQQQQQQQQLQPFVQPIGSELYPQSQPYYQQQQQQQQHQEPMPYHPQQRRSNNRRLDPNYNMMFSSQGSSTDDEGGNDSSTTSNTGNESLDQRQRQQLATVNGGVGGGHHQHHHNSPNRNNRRSYNTRPSTTTASTTSNNSLNLSAQDYMDDKADEREIRRQLATQGQAIGAYAIDDEAPNRQEVRGRRTRVSRTESQRRARLAELGNGSGGGGGGGGVAAATTIAEGDLVDADIERMEEYEYRNLSMSQKAFSKIGLGGEDKWTERVVCLTFGVCFVVLVIAISLYVARG